jgi:uncharacterized membrane protein YhaH (DUF805 family)
MKLPRSKRSVIWSALVDAVLIMVGVLAAGFVFCLIVLPSLSTHSANFDEIQLAHRIVLFVALLAGICASGTLLVRRWRGRR